MKIKVATTLAIASAMLGCNTDDLNYDLSIILRETARMTTEVGKDLGCDAIAVIISVWRMQNPGKRAFIRADES